MINNNVLYTAKGINNPGRSNPGVKVSSRDSDSIPEVNYIVFTAHVKDIMCKTLVKIQKVFLPKRKDLIFERVSRAIQYFPEIS